MIAVIHLANVNFHAIKIDEVLLLITKDLDLCRSDTLCIAETWLSELLLDGAIKLLGFQLLRAGCKKEPTGDTKGGGICFYVN